MKSPTQLVDRLARQWENADLREARLLNEPDAWPVKLPIGKPQPAAIRDCTTEVRNHIDAWRAVTTGEVQWSEANYRSTAEAVRYPAHWLIPDTETWIRACANRSVATQHHQLSQFLNNAAPEFHRLLIRRRALWQDRETEDVDRALEIVLKLQPGVADGLPLRALPIIGNDTKFFERNEYLLLALLDIRFDGEASRQGLEPFLGAYAERGHWLLVLDLDGSLLPFSQLRLRASDLAEKPLPGSHLLIVENETCQHQLPKLASTIAVLGTGFDLAWTAADWLHEKHTAYWGDLDTWGLDLLTRARKNLPELTPLLMTREVFDSNQQHAVPEKVPAASSPPSELNRSERVLYHHLRELPKGRLEQEFLPQSLVAEVIDNWGNRQSQ